MIDEHFDSIGVSSSQPILDKDGKEDEKASRRIEIEVVFKDELEEILDNVLLIKNQKPIYLSDYVKRLLIENQTLAQKISTLQGLKQDIKIANASFYPTATLNYKNTQYLQSDPTNLSSVQSTDVTIKYNLFNKYSDEKQEQILKANFKSSEYLKEQTETELIYSLAEAFLNLKKQKDILDLAQENLDDYDIWLSKEDIKFQKKLISLREYAKVQSRDANQRVNFEELRRIYQDNISTFQKYLDFNSSDIDSFEELTLDNKYLTNKKLAYDDMQIYSAYIKEAKTNVQMYRLKKEQSEVNFYPIVDLVAKKSVTNTDYEVDPSVTSKETSISFEAKLEFYSGGKDEANYQKKLLEYQQMVNKLKEVSRDTKYRLNLAFNKYLLAQKKEELLLHLIDKKEESLYGATYDYKFAKIDANGLLDAVDELYMAKKTYIENSYDRQIAIYKILSIIGNIKEFIFKKHQEMLDSQKE